MAALKTYTKGDTVTHDDQDWVVVESSTAVTRRGVDETLTDPEGNEVQVEGQAVREELNLTVKLNPA